LYSVASLSQFVWCGLCVECSSIKTVKGDLIPYLVQDQFTEKKTSQPTDDINSGTLIYLTYLSK